MMQDNHIFRGMRRDSHPIRQEKQFLWDAHNIRLTARDGSTMLSLTNEKSTESLITFNKNESYIGHTTLGEYLIILTTANDFDRIYRIKTTEDNVLSRELLYEGKDLNFKSDHPASIISEYESKLVQKIYWVDGYNPPRVMNVAKPELLYPDDDDGSPNLTKVNIYIQDGSYSRCYLDHPFNFILDLKLLERVHVKRIQSNGIFPAGVIQYAFTYYNKYGQESNIFDVTEPLYIAFNDRGGSPEDRVSTAFQVTIEKVQATFDYLRIYSIVRTSIDSVPTVKRVTDIELKSIKGSTITYNDDNTTGDIIDPTVLLYIGGKNIIANCIAAKDNTLFLGDINYERKHLLDISRLNSGIRQLEVTTDTRKVLLPRSISSFYEYSNQLSENTSTFKVGEVYRLGLQFQYKNGEWSEPMWVKDAIMDKVRPVIANNGVSLPIFKASLNTSVKDILINEDYLKVRPLVVLPDISDRNILAQGMICPTVFNLRNRLSGSLFSQSSWLLRPFCTKSPTSSNTDSTASLGSIAEFRHLNPLLSGLNRGAEIQNMFLDEGATSNMSDTHNYSLDTIDLNDTSYNSLYYVDQSVLTFHSPDIEFDDSLQASIDNASLTMSLVGVIPFNSNYGDIDIQTTTPQIDPNAAGYIHNPINTDGSRSLISGLFYEDSYVDEATNAESFYRQDAIRPWLVYLWHRSGSLNNDCVRPEGKGTQTALLKKKIISNIKFSKEIVWLKRDKEVDLNVTELQLFNSNEVSLIKQKDNNSNVGDITYYGNVDSMSPSYSKFRLVSGESKTYQLLVREYGFKGFIKVTAENNTDKVIPFLINVGDLTGSTLTGTVRGKIISNTVVAIPIMKVDPSTGEVTYENENFNLSGGAFSITITPTQRFDGTISVNNNIFIISGVTPYQIIYKPHNSREEVAFNFSAKLMTVDPSPDYIGDYQEALKLPKDAVRIKYKSTPHIFFTTRYGQNNTRDPLPIIYGTSTKPINFGEGHLSKLPWLKQGNSINQVVKNVSDFEGLSSCPSAYLWLAEIRQDVDDTKRFGGSSLEALQSNLWLPAGPSVPIDSNIEWLWGDTWFQRFDCLKTYPFTNEDINQMVEIGSFLCETRVNIDGRYDRNRGAASNLNMSPLNFNKINPVYSQKNTFFNYRILDPDYYKNNHYSSQILWSGVKSPSATQDEWTRLHLASSLDLDGTNGKIIAIQPFNDILLSFQERAVSQILFNSRVQIQASDGVPIEIANNQKVEGVRVISSNVGCQDKFSIVETPTGIYFMDNNNSSLYKFDGQLSNISLQLGSLYWARDNHWDVQWRYKKLASGYNGVRLSYDPKYQDIYFIPGADPNDREALCYSEQLGQFTSMMSYGGSVMFPYKNKFYSIAQSDKDVMTLWENFSSKGYNNIFGTPREYSLSFISNDNPAITKIFDTIEMRADCYIPNNDRDDNFGLQGSDLIHLDQTGKPFNFIRVDNEYQDTGEVVLDNSNMRKKFRVWRALIPRKKGSRERIRNPWAKITLGMKNPKTKMTILHDLNVGYTV